MPPFVIVVSDDPVDRDWVWAALDQAKPVARAAGHRVAPAIFSAPVHHVLEDSGGQALTKQTDPPRRAQDAPVDTLLLPIPLAAKRVPTSVRTLRRRIADGTLQTVSIGRTPFIRPAELDRFIAALRAKGAA